MLTAALSAVRSAECGALYTREGAAPGRRSSSRRREMIRNMQLEEGPRCHRPRRCHQGPLAARFRLRLFISRVTTCGALLCLSYCALPIISPHFEGDHLLGALLEAVASVGR